MIEANNRIAMDQNIIPVEAIRERNIDLILLEELTTDFSFCRWLVERLKLPPLLWRGILIKPETAMGEAMELQKES